MNRILHLDDCRRIQSTLLGHWGIEATLSECQGLWYMHCRANYSRSSWFALPPDQTELAKTLEELIDNLQWSWDGPYAAPESR